MGTTYKKNRIKSRICWAIALVLAAVMLVVSILPFIFMVLNSFKGKFEMLTKGVFSLPASLNTANYQEVLAKGFFRYFFNDSGFFSNSCFTHFFHLLILMEEFL